MRQIARVVEGEDPWEWSVLVFDEHTRRFIGMSAKQHADTLAATINAKFQPYLDAADKMAEALKKVKPLLERAAPGQFATPETNQGSAAGDEHDGRSELVQIDEALSSWQALQGGKDGHNNAP